jgi:hypothetical protein
VPAVPMLLVELLVVVVVELVLELVLELELVAVVVAAPRPRATDDTHIPWLLTDGLCGFVAVQLLRATDETVEPWFPLPPCAWVGDSPPTTRKAQAITRAMADAASS